MLLKNLTSYLDHKFILVLSFLFLIFYLVLSFNLNIWIDESFTLETISNDTFRGLIRSSIIFEGQPPFYFLVAFFWSKVSNTVFSLRLLSSLLTISSGWLVYKLYEDNSPNPSRWILALIYANPFMVYIATEIRCYALVVFFAVVLIRLFLKYYSRNNVPVRIRILFIIISIAAVNTQYFLAFLLLANGMYLLAMGLKKATITYLIDMTFVLASLSWVPFIILDQIDAHLYKQIEITIQSLMIDFIRKFDYYIFSSSLFPFLKVKFFILIFIIVMILFHFLRTQRIKEFFVNNLYFIFSGVVITSCFLVFYPILGPEFLGKRHTAILYPPIILIFFILFDYIQTRYLKGFIILLLLLFYTSTNINQNRFYIKKTNILGAITYISENSNDNESIVLIENMLARPFIYHFDGPNNIIIIPYPIDITKPYDYEILEMPLDVKYLQRLFRSLSHEGNYWILNFTYSSDNNLHLSTINSIINSCIPIESDTILSDPKKFRTYQSIQIRKSGM